jgi:hypothetical protein
MIRVVIAIAIVAASTTSRAQPAGAQAEVLFHQGRDLMAAGKVTEACAAFEASQKLDPAITTLINLAGCREKAGQLATAWGLFLEAERLTRSASNDATRQLHDLAQQRSQKLELRVSKLAINVPQKSQIDGLEIVRGQDRVDSVMWNRALPIDSGTYTITARAPGANVWSTEVTIGAEGDTKTVDIPDLRNLARDLDPAAAAQPTGTSEPPHDPRPSPQRLIPLVVGAGAVTLLAGAVVLDLSGNSTYSDAKAEMTNQARRDALYSSANTKRYAAEGLAVAGIGCAGLAVWFYLQHRDEHPTATARKLIVSPTGVAFVGSF